MSASTGVPASGTNTYATFNEQMQILYANELASADRTMDQFPGLDES